MRQEQIVKKPRRRERREQPLAALQLPCGSGTPDADDLIERIDQILEAV